MLTKLAGAAALAVLPLLATAATGAAQSITPVAGSCSAADVPASTPVAAVPEMSSTLVPEQTSGTAMVQVDLDADGHLLNATIAKTSGDYFLDRSAILAARESSFRPEIVNCEGIPGSYLFEVDFP